MNEQIKIPKLYVDLLDQVFEVERKVEALQETNSISRNLNKIKELFENSFSTASEIDTGLSYYNPIGEPYSDTRTDLEVSVAGNNTENLVVTEVIKPVIRYRKGNVTLIARKGIVIVESNTQKS